MDRCTDERMDRVLSEYLASIGRRWQIEKAILFGSRSRDDYMLDSDVDLRNQRKPQAIMQNTIVI